LTGRPMKRIDERELREELVKLRAEHRELDDQIILLEDQASADQLLVKRLKKRKLAIKDRMTAIEDQLLPDIIASAGRCAAAGWPWDRSCLRLRGSTTLPASGRRYVSLNVSTAMKATAAAPMIRNAGAR
jgi:hypothetical protein